MLIMFYGEELTMLFMFCGEELVMVMICYWVERIAEESEITRNVEKPRQHSKKIKVC